MSLGTPWAITFLLQCSNIGDSMHAVLYSVDGLITVMLLFLIQIFFYLQFQLQ